jgi:hypothetical protein
MFWKELNIHEGCFRAALPSGQPVAFYATALYYVENRTPKSHWNINLQIPGKEGGSLTIKVIKGKITFVILKSAEYGSRKYITEYTAEIKHYLIMYFNYLCKPRRFSPPPDTVYAPIEID